MSWELKIETLEFRWETLAISYLLNLNTKPFNLMNHTASKILYGGSAWKHRSTPSIVPLATKLASLNNLTLVNKNASSERPIQSPLWDLHFIKLVKLPIT